MKFTIVEQIDTGKQYLAFSYWLDPNDKWTLFAKWEEGKHPEFHEYGTGFNEYKNRMRKIGYYTAEHIATNGKGKLIIQKQKSVPL